MAAEPGLSAPGLVAVARRAPGVDPVTRRRAVLEVVDAVACMRLGASHPLVTEVAGASSWQEPGAHPSFIAAGVGLEDAVRFDALACHVDELDSIEPASAVVPGALVVPAALHVARHVGASGAALVDAVLAGYDVLTYVGRSLGGPQAYGHGWWPSSTIGAVGAATAVGLLLGLDDEQLAAALGLTAARTGGLLSDDVLDAGHYLAAADATVAGLRAGLLAASGLRASPTYLSMPATRALPSWRAVEPPAPGDGVRGTQIKAFPCARPLHGFAAALLDSDVALDRLSSVVLELPAPLLRFVSTDVVVPDATRAAASAVHVLAAVRAGHATDARFFRAASLAGLAPLPAVELREWPTAAPGSWACRVLLRSDTGEERTLAVEPPVLAPEQVPDKAARTFADAGVPVPTAAGVLNDLLDLDRRPTVRDLRLHQRLSGAVDG